MMYHSSPSRNRASIAAQGLRVDMDAGGGLTAPGVYVSPQPSSSPHEDVWEVDTSGIDLRPDAIDQRHEFRDVGGSFYSEESISKERVRLHRAANPPTMGPQF